MDAKDELKKVLEQDFLDKGGTLEALRSIRTPQDAESLYDTHGELKMIAKAYLELLDSWS